MKSKGYMGKIARIDLDTGTITRIKLDDTTVRRFIGGSGLGAKILFDHTSVETDPLGPENLLIFAVGPCTGTRIFNSNRYQVVTKSPLTGIYGEANCGGNWGEIFKKCGYDALVVRGASKTPVSIYMDEKRITVEDASSLWGKETFEVDEFIRAKYGTSAESAVIGPAGENLVKIANIVTDGKHARAAGRCGVGAVMGSKRLKAVVVKGTSEVPVASEDGIRQLMRRIAPQMNEFSRTFKQFGTSGGMENCEKIGNIPVKNWYQGPFEGAGKISGQRMAETILTGRYHCGRCVMNCGRVVKAADGPYRGMEIGGPEYETLALLGSNCLIDDISCIAKGNELCNRYGLDTISTGGVIGFAMEAYERGLVTEKDTGGVPLKWGSCDALLKLIEMVAFRKNIGDLLAEGVRNAAQRIGGTAAEFSIHVKGLEPPAHDPRAKMTVALGFATSNRGACHLQAFTHDFEEKKFIEDLGMPQLTDRFAKEGKAYNVFLMQNLMSMFDSLTCCKFVLFGGITVKPLTEFLNNTTGWDLTDGEFMKIGERLYNLKRMYNVRLGISRKDDTLPPRMLVHRRGGGTNVLPPIGELLNEYYEYRGWDEFGIPTDKKLQELGLEEYIHGRKK
ncbi:MAG: aldehyde ferredoxin oxidoreductase family protein [Spirochaetes bacterium]|nr:aldehyde ferredoxin oxidoreductase family protein [Spirochaetota bacterium]